LALVFAMSGGALAAKHYLVSSPKQISPKVLKSFAATDTALFNKLSKSVTVTKADVHRNRVADDTKRELLRRGEQHEPDQRRHVQRVGDLRHGVRVRRTVREIARARGRAL
jgi:hypothetical protein